MWAGSFTRNNFMELVLVIEWQDEKIHRIKGLKFASRR
jgi:hypothetical protein